MDNYIDHIMSNHIFASENTEELYIDSDNKRVVQDGGANASLKASKKGSKKASKKGSKKASKKGSKKALKSRKMKRETQDTNNYPTGGFPPIVIVDREVVKVEETVKKRELSTLGTSLSLKQILEKKKD